jgi:hypothetical protein
MDLILPMEYRLEARLTNAMTKLNGVDWCIPQHVKSCDYDLIRRMVVVEIRDDVEGQVSRFFEAFYRDSTPCDFFLYCLHGDRVTSTRVFDDCTVLKHRVKQAETNFNALLSHKLILRYSSLRVS